MDDINGYGLFENATQQVLLLSAFDEDGIKRVAESTSASPDNSKLQTRRSTFMI